MTCDLFTQLALSFPHTITVPHFNRTAFKVLNKKIFATLHEENKTANLKLSPVTQSDYCFGNKDAVYPVNNKWGLQGWTTFELDKIDSQLMLDALDTAYKETFITSRKK